MPKLMNTSSPTLEVFNVPGTGSFQFSAIRPEDLESTEYTLVTIVLDLSGSVAQYAKNLLDCVKAVVDACKKHPRSENLLFRILTFSFHNEIKELHGFKMLYMIDSNDYKPFSCNGYTALFDATNEAIAPTLAYAKTLTDQDFKANAVIYIITDGEDNDSVIATPKSIKKQLNDAISKELIESLITILIGVNDAQCKSALEAFQIQADLTQYVSLGEATPQKLAKLAAFVSKSISSQSQALGTGGPSQNLTF